MSRARSVPAFMVAKSAPCMNGTASAKASRSPSEPGQVRGRLEAGRVHREQEQREDEREDDVRRLARRAHDRPSRELTDLLDEPSLTPARARVGSSSSSPAPSSERPVLARKTSSSDGWCSWRFSTFRFSASRPNDLGQVGLARLHRSTLDAAHGSPKRARIAARSFSSRSAGTTSTVGRPTSAFNCRSSLGDDPAVVDDPDPVGEDVGLLEVLRRQEDGDAVVLREAAHLFPERAALDVEAGRRLVEEEDLRRVDEGEREVEPPSSARVAADLAVGRLREADALEQEVAAPGALGARDSLQRRLQAQVLAAREQRVERRLLARRRSRPTCGPRGRCRSRPRWRAAVGGRSVVSMCTVVDLPAPLGPRNP